MKKLFAFVLFVFFTGIIIAQDTTEIDTLEFMKPPKNPTVASVLSGVLPGAGQIYNGYYWKVPIIYTFLGGTAFSYYETNKFYKIYLHDLWLLQKMNDGDTPQNYALLYTGITVESQLENMKNQFRRYRDISIFAFGFIWAANILDAYVDAQFSNFDVSDDLSGTFTPYFFYLNKTPYYGLKLKFYLTDNKRKINKL